MMIRVTVNNSGTDVQNYHFFHEFEKFFLSVGHSFGGTFDTNDVAVVAIRWNPDVDFVFGF